MNKLSWKWTIALALIGCSDTAGGSACGVGVEHAFAGSNYCVYEKGLIEEGFLCPASLPNRYSFEDFEACGAPSQPPMGLDEDIKRTFGGVPIDDGGISVDDGGVPIDDGGISVDAGTAGLVGLYHLPTEIDAISLSVNADGTFAWGIDGCDFSGGGNGEWQATETGAVFVPRTGADDFFWNTDITFQARLTELTVTPNMDGSLQAVIPQVLDQKWLAGGICADCGGNLGPTGLTLCTDPYVCTDCN